MGGWLFEVALVNVLIQGGRRWWSFLEEARAFFATLAGGNFEGGILALFPWINPIWEFLSEKCVFCLFAPHSFDETE
jgi:hypothetical protein